MGAQHSASEAELRSRLGKEPGAFKPVLIDVLADRWRVTDKDGNGLLDRQELPLFLNEVAHACSISDYSEAAISEDVQHCFAEQQPADSPTVSASTVARYLKGSHWGNRLRMHWNGAAALGAVTAGVKAREAMPSTVHRYVVRKNHLLTAGMWLMEAYDADTFRVYTVQLPVPLLQQHMGTKLQGWNRKYSAAQKIFGDRPDCALVRSTIVTEHACLYREVGIDRSTQGYVRTGEDLMGLLRNGVVKRSTGRRETVFFTYVLLPDGSWNFSHTGVGTLRDFASKHAMHANACPEVVYSGEFHVERGSDGALTLVLDNNSGTYAPDKDCLPKIAALFRAAFPGLQVDAWDRQDPRLTEAIAACPSRREAGQSYTPEGAPANVVISSTVDDQKGRKKFVVTYDYQGSSHVVQRYYSDFEHLRVQCPWMAHLSSPFPAKTLMKCTGAMLDERRTALEKWLREAVEDCWLDEDRRAGLEHFMSPSAELPEAAASTSSLSKSMGSFFRRSE